MFGPGTPLHKEPVWLPIRRLPRGAVPAALRPLLYDVSSLTRTLQLSCGDGFSVRLLRQRWERPLPSEAQLLRLRRGTWGLVREVQLRCGDAAQVFARTVIPAPTLVGKARRLRHLGERPLGGFLFAQRSLGRGELQVACLRPGHPLYGRAVAGLAEPPAAIWGRRSLFFLGRRPLLVSEFFLDAAAAPAAGGGQ